MDIIIKGFSREYINNWSGIEPVNLLSVNYTSRPGQKEHINLANNQVSHTQKLNQEKKSGNQIHQLACQKHSCTAPSGRQNHSTQR
jgi:hypothetical protein